MDFLTILSAVRDIVIILLGLVWLIAGILVAVVAWVVWRFVRTVPRRVDSLTGPAQEVLGQAREAVGTAGESARTAREAVAFVSEKAVMPTIMVASAAAGARRFVEVLLGGNRRDGQEG